MNDDNDVDQKYNLNIVPSANKHKWIITTPNPPKPTSKSISDQIITYHS